MDYFTVAVSELSWIIGSLGDRLRPWNKCTLSQSNPVTMDAMDVKPVVSLPSTEAAIESTSTGCGTTHVHLSQLQYTWTLKNFSFCNKKTGQWLTSPLFVHGTNNKTKWVLRVFPNSVDNKNQGYLSVYLVFVSGGRPEADIKCKISILNAEKKKTVIRQFEDTRKFTKNSSSWGWPNFVQNSLLRDSANCLLPNDSLTIVCDITVVEGIVQSVGNGDSQAVVVPECRLIDDFSELYKSGELYDVMVVGCDREFPAHSAILAARSSVFSAMFNKYKQPYRIYVKNVDDDVVNEMLAYIYTGQTKNLNKMAEGLLVVADRYQLARLKALSENSLCQSLEIKNAVRRLIAAELHGAFHLKAQILDFVSKHMTEVMKTADYPSMRYTHPHLMGEVLELWSKEIAASAAAATAVSDSSGSACKKRKIENDL